MDNAAQFISHKIHTAASLAIELSRQRLKSKTIVFTNGCFDILHAGHIESLTKAAGFGNFLVVAVNSDASVKKLKGPARPVNSEQSRALLLAALVMVDGVVIFEEDTPQQLIATLLPDVLVKGGDYTVEQIAGAEEVLANGGKVEIIPLLPGFSTTDIIEKMGHS
jgi:D-glycero-beta-D-manno-heptose 1-phosphate adenylyltransferase